MSSESVEKSLRDKAKERLEEERKLRVDYEYLAKKHKIKEQEALKEFEKTERDLLVSFYGTEEAQLIVDGWKARLRVLHKNTKKYTSHQVEYEFKGKEYFKVLTDRDFKAKGSGSPMEKDACTVLGIVHTETDTMPYFSKGS